MTTHSYTDSDRQRIRQTPRKPVGLLGFARPLLKAIRSERQDAAQSLMGQPDHGRHTALFGSPATSTTVSFLGIP